MSPRFPSAITSSPARRAYTQTSSNAAIPAGPSPSKNASCGLTATACGATASTSPQQKRAASPRSSTGSRSRRGSRPTTSCDCLRSTSAARRSAKVCTATAIGLKGNEKRGGRPTPPSGNLRTRERLALEGSLELGAGRELRHGRRRDLDALTGARVDALTRRALRGRELPEPGEVDRIAALQRLGDGLHEGIHGLAGVTSRKAALLRDLLDEILLGQRTSSCFGDWG